MLQQLAVRVQAAILRRPRRVLWLCCLSVALALALGWEVEFRTSRTELAPADDPDQRRWTALIEEYGGSEALIACVEASPLGEHGGPGEHELRRFADALAVRIGRDPRVEHVFHRVDLDWFLEHGAYLAAPDELRAMAAQADAGRDLVEALRDHPSLPGAIGALARRIETELDTATAPSGEAQSLDAVVGLLAELRAWLEDPTRHAERFDESPWLLLAGRDPRLAAGGYLTTFDGRTLFLVISPRDADDDLTVRRGLLAAMRRHVAELDASGAGIRVAFTGTPAMAVEEMDTVRRDTWVTSIVAVLGVSLLTTQVFRWRSHALLVLVSLAAGIAWAFGAVRLELGSLNLITSSFISTLVGVGVAYGIHPVSEYELEGAHIADPRRAVREAFSRTAPGVLVAATTTAAAFFSILLMRFRGFAELGLVAGFGVLLCLVAAQTCLPALLLVYGERRHRRDRQGRGAAPVDRLWVEQLAGRVARRPVWVTTGALLITAIMAWQAFGVSFSTNILDLLPDNAESLLYQRRMALESNLAPLSNVVVAADLASLAALRERAEAEPAIARFESALDFLPVDAAGSRGAIAELADRLPDLELPSVPRDFTIPEFSDALVRLEQALAETIEASFGTTVPAVTASLEAARSEVERSIERVEGSDPSDLSAWLEGQRRLWDWVLRGTAELERALAAEPPTRDDLPVALQRRFFTRSGAPLGFLMPRGSVFDSAELEAFVAASRRVAPDVTGFPVVFLKSAERITSGFYRAVLAGAVLVALILWIDYRSFRHTAMALVPLGLGLVWMTGLMGLFGLPFNFANLVAVPLVIGVGIDNGVHVVHRVLLEGRSGIAVVLRHTGRAIVIASLTTMIGFGSLVLASHRGMSSLGLVLLLGVGSCLVTSTVVLPNLLVLLGIVEE